MKREGNNRRDIRFHTMQVRMPTRNILRFRFLVESYDGLANTRTIDKQAGLVELTYPPQMKDDLEVLLDSLASTLEVVRT